MTYQDGWNYEGEFKMDMKSGPGVLKYSNGHFIKGIWSMDEIQTAV